MKQMLESNNKRIAKNTFYLYIRMAITMIVALYTSRVVLNTLGVIDFGIYNVVGGVVVMFGFITNTLATASQRFLAYEIGTRNLKKLRITFNVTVTIYLLFAIIVFTLGETVGLWFIKNKLTIPSDRMVATIWVFHFSLLAFVAAIIRIPYNALIIAHEKMSFFAWSSIIEVLLKLIIVFMLFYFSIDKLVLYSILMFCVVSLVSLVYIFFCLFYFPESKYRMLLDKELLHSMLSFSGYSLFDSLANVAKNQGVNIILNIFFSPTINAARGIAYQIGSQIISFVGNFQLAASPQITKYYANDNKEEMKKLYFQSSRLSFFLLFIISLPVLFEMELILKWWLAEVPGYSVIFARLIVINSLIDCMLGTSNLVIQSTGNIKYYQIFSGIIMLLNLPLSYFFLTVGYPPESTFIISIIVSSILVLVRLYIIQAVIHFKMLEYIDEVIKKNLIICVVAPILPLFVFVATDQNITTFFTICFISIFASAASIYVFGLNKDERDRISHYYSSMNLKRRKN